MTTDPIRLTSNSVDLSGRFIDTTTVVASPALAAETIIASLTIDQDLVVAAGVRLRGWAANTVGANGVSIQLRIRQTNVSGTLICDSGATGAAAASVNVRDVLGVDTAPVLPNQVYVLTMQVASATAASTVSAVYLGADVI